MRRLVSNIDKKFSLTVKKIPKRFFKYMSLITHLGGISGIGSIILISCAVALYNQDFRLIRAFTVAVAASFTIFLLKWGFKRSRPDTDYSRSMKFPYYSFPSGHAFSSLVIFGLLGYTIFLNASLFFGSLIILTAIILVLSIGLSRVYLGAHYPSDVLAGWAIGTVCLVGIIQFILR